MLQNPINPEAPYMRDDMLYGLLTHVSKNSKFFDEFKLFDIGKIWNKKQKTENNEQDKNIFASEFVNEKMQLGAMIYQKNIDQWDKDPILEAKHFVSVIAKELELGTLSFEKTMLTQFHPKKQAMILVKNHVI
ncbi:MAG: hypothetical protein WCI00_01605 [bacterium]